MQSEIVNCETSDLLEYILQVLHSASCGRIQSSCTQPNVKFTSKTMAIHNLVNILREKKNWKHTFYPLIG